jgi:hypothetical protein
MPQSSREEATDRGECVAKAGSICLKDSAVRRDALYDGEKFRLHSRL